MIKVTFVNNDGGGFAREVEVANNKSIAEFCYEEADIHSDSETGDFAPSKWKIRVNRNCVPAGYILQNSDRVTVTPINVKGA